MNTSDKSKPLNILLVDTSGRIMEFFENLKKAEQYCIDHVGSPEEAASRLEEEVYDIVIADGSIPHRKGLRLLKKAQKIQPEAAAVLITPGTDAALEKEVIEIGARYFDDILMLEDII